MSDNASAAEEWMSGLLDAIYSVMKPLVNPLVEKWDSVTGDAQAVYDVAARWQGMADTMREISSFERESAQQTADGWIGMSGDAYRAWAGELAGDMDEIAQEMSQLKGFLDEAAGEVQAVEEMCRQLIYELVEWAAITLAVSAAGAIFTFGASVAAGAASAAARAGITGAKIARLLRDIAMVLRRLKGLITKYKMFLKKKRPFIQKRIIKQADKMARRTITGLDGNYKEPLIGLAEVRYGADLPGGPAPSG